MVRIDSVEWGKVKVDGKTYYSDMYVYWDGKTEMKSKSHLFDMDELVKLLKKNPEMIVIGTGHNGIVKVPEEVVQMAENKKIALLLEKSPVAADVFNGLAKDGKKVIAVIHSTC